MNNPSIHNLRQAIGIRKQIGHLETKLSRLLNGAVNSVESVKRPMSAATKAKLSRAAKKRWARVRAAK